MVGASAADRVARWRGTTVTVLPPARTPCKDCPYRQDVPSGIWEANEYAKLPRYDGPTYEQPFGLFLCHLRDRKDPAARVCGGWAGCHDGDELMGIRVALVAGEITVETARAIKTYKSPVPLFGSGAEAAAHGMRELENPGPDARRAARKISRIRSNLT